MVTLDELLHDVFGNARPDFFPEFEAWVRASRRFRSFVSQHTAKIRTKLKHVRDDAAMKDLRAELEAAMLLLRDERFALEYEKYAASRQRGPDFTVTFKTHTPFNVEVRRIRGAEPNEEHTNALTGKLMAALVDKVGQMPPSIINVLWLTAERDISEADLNQATTALRRLAEQRAEEFFMRRGYETASHFVRRYAQLSGILVHQIAGNTVWLNGAAKHKMPPEIVNALRRL